MRRNAPIAFSIQAIAVAAAILAVCVLVNAVVDVRGIYFRRGGVDDLGLSAYVSDLRVQPYGLVHDLRQRPIKRELLKQTDAECFVLGSSHITSITVARLPSILGDCRGLANLSIPGAVFEDHVGYLALIAEKPGRRKVVLSIPPWAFRQNLDGRWRLTADLYDRGRAYFGLVPRPGAAAVSGDWLLNLINFDYLKQNVELLVSGRTDRRFEATPVRADHAGLAYEDSVTLADGSIVYSAKALDGFRQPWARVGTGDYKIRKPYVTPQLVADHDRMLTILGQRGIEMVFILMPYHPKVLTCLFPPVCEAMRETERVARDLARRHGIKVVGGFDPAPFGIGAEEFYDHQHLAKEAIIKLEAAPPPAR